MDDFFYARADTRPTGDRIANRGGHGELVVNRGISLPTVSFLPGRTAAAGSFD